MCVPGQLETDPGQPDMASLVEPAEGVAEKGLLMLVSISQEALGGDGRLPLENCLTPRNLGKGCQQLEAWRLADGCHPATSAFCKQ